jgi:hypothetical protein
MAELVRGIFQGVAVTVLGFFSCLACGTADDTSIPPLVNLEIANKTVQPVSLALDSDNIYVSSQVYDAQLKHLSGVIHRVAKGGGTVLTISNDAQPTQGVAVDDISVYYTDETGGPRSTGKEGGTVKLVGTDTENVWSVAVDADHVYWTGADTGTIGSSTKNGVDKSVLAADAGQPIRITYDATRVYWCNLAGEVWSVSKQGGDQVKLASGSRPADYIVLDDDYVYFTGGGVATKDGSVSRVPKQGGNSTAIAQLGDSPQGLALNNGKLYVGTASGIQSFSTDGTDQKLLTGTATVGNDIAVDSDAVYWISDDGGVYRSPK